VEIKLRFYRGKEKELSDKKRRAKSKLKSIDIEETSVYNEM